jgi:hypothetical protein
LIVIPAKAGIHLDLAVYFHACSHLARCVFAARTPSMAFFFDRHPADRVTFSDSGHPALRPFGVAFGVRAAPAAQCAAKRK